ncbi:MAG: hypothetical protein ACYCZN_13155 [Candidatus Dormibacteria bacterium]
MSLFAERVADMAAGLAMRAGAAIGWAWHSESVAPEAAATRQSPPAIGGSPIPRTVDWANKAELASGLVRQQGSAVPAAVVEGSALPGDPRPRAIMAGSALPVDARPRAVVAEAVAGSVIARSVVPPDVVDEARKQAAVAKATRARQAEVSAPHHGQSEELQL